MTNAQWNALFPNASLVNGEMTKSDHRPLIVDIEYLPDVNGRDDRRPRRFEARWLHEDTVEAMVQAAWARANACGEGPTFMQKTAQVHEELHV